MATASTNATTFLWQGLDRRGSVVKGEAQAAIWKRWQKNHT